jgi:sporulation protein YlmC with PRC-barrel domain
MRLPDRSVCVECLLTMFMHGDLQVPCHERGCAPARVLPDRHVRHLPMQPPPCNSYDARPKPKETSMTTPSGHTSAIRAKKVIGTSVKNTAGQKIGQVEDIVLDKQSNKIIYAVVGFGGFLGMNEKYHPVPWSALDYVESEGSYVVPFTKEQLEAAPADSLEQLTRNDGAAAYATKVDDYYNIRH